MKLAEALLERADLKSKIEMMRGRLINNAKVQEGVAPTENPNDLIVELNEKLERMEWLIVHINKTNAEGRMSTGETIAEGIAKKEVLTKKISILASFIDYGSSLASRNTHSEIRILPSADISQLQKTVDKYSKELRVLDAKIQESNWNTELL